MRIYVDSSALVKRVLDEPERTVLIESLDRLVASDELLVSSTLTWVEVTRTIRSRLDDESPARVVDFVDAALSGILETPLTPQVMSLARRLGPASLRSLDAIHLASATLIGADLVCAYDDRLLRSAEELGFRTMSPGR